MKNNEYVKDKLNAVIEEMALNKESFVKNPDKDFIRNRKITFQDTIKLILAMRSNTLNKELYDYFGKDPESIATSSAFIQQRDKLEEGTFEYLFYAFNKSMTDFKTYKGYKLYAIDGSDINVAYDKEADTYVKYTDKTKKDGSERKGFNQVHLNAIYDLLNKVYVDAILQPKPSANERKAFINMLEKQEYENKTLFIADRGYPSWNIFAHFKYKTNVDFLFRIKNEEYKIVKVLPMTELDVNRSIIISTKGSDIGKDGYVKINVKKNKMTNREYKGNTKFVDWNFGEREELSVRIVRFKITENTYETIITSLPRDKFPIEEIKKLYGMRWGIETSFRELKYIIGLTNLHCKREDFVVQEIYARLTMYNFCERILQYTVIEQDENRKYQYQVNFTMAMQICIDFFKSLVSEIGFYDLVCKYIVPIRPGRADKRKMRAKTFVSFIYRVA